MRSLTHLLWIFLFAVPLAAVAGCGDSPPPEPFTVRLIAADGNVPDQPRVILNAVDGIEMVFVPRMGQRFAPMEPLSFEDGTVRMRVTNAGELVLLMDRAFVVDNAVPNGATFQLDVPIFTAQDPRDIEPEVRAPTLRVNVLRQGTRIAEGDAPVGLPWPLPEGDAVSVTLVCRDDSLIQCRDMDAVGG
jgi:hypothetical protein